MCTNKMFFGWRRESKDEEEKCPRHRTITMDCQDKNRLFLEECHSLVGRRGAFGQVKIFQDQSGRATVTKTSLTDQLFKKLALSKERVMLKILSKTDFVPQLLHVTLDMDAKTNLPFTTSITMDFVGPTVYLCTTLGFHLDPPKMLRQLLSACQHLHGQGILHLDLKPDNVTYDLRASRFKLIDFAMCELTGYHDMECGVGVQRLTESIPEMGGQDVGRVTEGGNLSRCVEQGFPFFQSSFCRPQLGKTRLKSWVNIAEYRDPTYLCCQALGTESGTVLDGGADIFAVSMIVLSHMQACETLLPQDKGGKLSMVASAMLKKISLVRGYCPLEQVIQWDTAMATSAAISMKTINNNHYRGMLEAFRSNIFGFLGSGERHGMTENIGKVFGRRFAATLRDAMHPITFFRPSAKEALRMLGTDEDEELQHVSRCPQWSVTAVKVNDHILVGKIIERHVCIMALSVKTSSLRLLWQMRTRYFRAKRVEVKRSMETWLVAKMHSVSNCCTDGRHAARWFLHMNRAAELTG